MGVRVGGGLEHWMQYLMFTSQDVKGKNRLLSLVIGARIIDTLIVGP